jgi:Domain of unknown function DUF1828
MIDCKQIIEAVRSFSLVMECDQIKGGLRIQTPFEYPDGSNIDVFLMPKSQADMFAKFDLTDMGQTTANLLDLHVKVWATKKRKQVVSDICESLKVDNADGVLKVSLENLGSLPDGIVRLTQACTRVSDLMFTQRLTTPIVLLDEVEEFLDVSDLKYEPSVDLPGPYGKPIAVDFLVGGKNSESVILTVGTASSASAHTASNEVFRKWHDLLKVRKDRNFISLFDSRYNAVRDEDVLRLGDVSNVIAFPDQKRDLFQMLAAA